MVSYTHPQFSRLFENKPTIVCPLGFRVQSICTSLNLAVPFTNGIRLIKYTERIAPWNELPISCDWSLTKYSKKTVAPQVLQHEIFIFSREVI